MLVVVALVAVDDALGRKVEATLVVGEPELFEGGGAVAAQPRAPLPISVGGPSDDGRRRPKLGTAIGKDARERVRVRAVAIERGRRRPLLQAVEPEAMALGARSDVALDLVVEILDPKRGRVLEVLGERIVEVGVELVRLGVVLPVEGGLLRVEQSVLVRLPKEGGREGGRGEGCVPREGGVGGRVTEGRGRGRGRGRSSLSRAPCV